MKDLTLSEWLTSTQERRDELDAYGKSPLPADAGERHADIEKAIQSADDSGRLLADAESYLTQAEALAVFSVRKDHPEITAREREIVARAVVRDVQRLVEGVRTTNRTINQRIFVIQNANRSRL